MAGYTGSIADHGRVIHIAKRREREKQDMELKRRKIQEESSSLLSFGDKFSAHYDAVEQHLKSSTVGLVTLEEMKAKRETVVQERERQLAHRKIEQQLKDDRARELERRLLELEEKKRQQRSCLSFDPDENEEEDGSSDDDEEPKPSTSAVQAVMVVKKKIGKDPTVDTSFLPDKDREEEENRLREELRMEWVQKQEEVKSEPINIAFSYWDGSGHRRDTVMKKGNTIHMFLQAALDNLRKDFNELKTVSADSLMFVKEDLIIPHFYTFHDFIVTKAMGKTGPLFDFNAAGELRIRQDCKKDSVESHPAKVVLRSWYERNKHIYPASRWEPFDPYKRYEREEV